MSFAAAVLQSCLAGQPCDTRKTLRRLRTLLRLCEVSIIVIPLQFIDRAMTCMYFPYDSLIFESSPNPSAHAYLVFAESLWSILCMAIPDEVYKPHAPCQTMPALGGCTADTIGKWTTFAGETIVAVLYRA